MATSKRMSLKERWQQTSISLGLKSPSKKSETIDKTSLKHLLNALLEENEEKAFSIYTAVDGSGRSLELDMHPSLPISENEDTPLHLAAAARAVSLVRVFIEHGGSPNTTNGSNQTCLHASCGGIQRNRGLSSGSLFKEVISLWDQVVIGRTSQSGEEDTQRRQCLQAECLQFLLSWRGLEIDGDSEKPVVNAVDDQGNTALHYAASHGLVTCCQSLIDHGAILTVVNKRQETACELAGSCEYVDLADALEALVIFNEAREDDSSSQEDLTLECTFRSLSAQDLTSLAVDRSLQAAACLNVSEKWSIHLLTVCSWNVTQLNDRAGEGLERLLEEAKVPPEAWERALKASSVPEWVEVGVSVLVNIAGEEEVAGEANNSMEATVMDIGEASVSVQLEGEDWEMDVAFENIKERPLRVCAVCTESLPLLKNSCGHAFCEECWSGYLTVQLREGSGAVPVCAAPSCALQVSATVASAAFRDDPDSLARWERVSSAAVAARAYDICPCPSPGCDRAILRSERAGDDINAICSEGHTFCWECKASDVHGPTSCEQWAAWRVLVREHLEAARESGVMGEESNENSQDIGNMLWLAANTKKCPKCTTPTEKIDGCNHMTCKQCRHEYCWICFKAWSLHSNKTGGYYRCNRFNQEVGVNTNNSGEGSASHDHKQRAAQAIKAERFIHYYTRYAAQQSSRVMEQAKKEDALSRIKLLQSRLSTSDLKFTDIREENLVDGQDTEISSGEGEGGGGVSDGAEELVWALTRELNVDFDMNSLLTLSFAELNHCRIVLRNSYAFAHLLLAKEKFLLRSYKERTRERRKALLTALEESSLRCESIQTELESITETLSEILARRYMRASSRQIRAVTAAAESCRLELIHVFHAHANFRLFEPPMMRTRAQRHGAADEWSVPVEVQEEQGVLSALLWGNDLKEQEEISRIIMESLNHDQHNNISTDLPTKDIPRQSEPWKYTEQWSREDPQRERNGWSRGGPDPRRSESDGWRSRGGQDPRRSESDAWRNRGGPDPRRSESDGWSRGGPDPLRSESDGWRNRGGPDPRRSESDAWRNRGGPDPRRSESDGWSRGGPDPRRSESDAWNSRGEEDVRSRGVRNSPVEHGQHSTTPSWPEQSPQSSQSSPSSYSDHMQPHRQPYQDHRSLDEGRNSEGRLVFDQETWQQTSSLPPRPLPTPKPRQVSHTPPLPPQASSSPTTHRMAVVPMRPSPKKETLEDMTLGIWVCRDCSWANSPWDRACSSCHKIHDNS